MAHTTEPRPGDSSPPRFFDVYELRKLGMTGSAFECQSYYELMKWSIRNGEVHQIEVATQQKSSFHLEQVREISVAPENKWQLKIRWTEGEETIVASETRALLLNRLRQELRQISRSSRQSSALTEAVSEGDVEVESQSASAELSRIGSFLNKSIRRKSLFSQRQHRRFFRLAVEGNRTFVEWASDENSKHWKRISLTSFDSSPEPQNSLTFIMHVDRSSKSPPWKSIIRVTAGDEATKEKWIQALRDLVPEKKVK